MFGLRMICLGVLLIGTMYSPILSAEDYQEHSLLTPTEVALKYCSYTQGPFPHWLLSDEFAHWILSEDLAIAQNIEAQLRERTPTSQLPHDLGVQRFLADHTLCDLEGIWEAGEGRFRVVLNQKIPMLREPMTRLSDPLDPQVWSDAFRETSRGEFIEDFLPLLLVFRDGSWFVDARLQTRIALPLERQKALENATNRMGTQHWSRVFDLLKSACDVPVTGRACLGLVANSSMFALRYNLGMRDRRAVKLGPVSVLSVSIGRGGRASVAKLEVQNDAVGLLHRVLVEIVSFGFDDQELGRSSCYLQSSSHKSQTLFEIPAGEKQVGYCPLPQASFLVVKYRAELRGVELK